MLFRSALLLWAMIQICIPAAQTKPQVTPTEDPPLCLYVDIEECKETLIKTQCINLCTPKTDPEICQHIKTDRCQADYVKAECSRKCRRSAIGAVCPSPWFTLGGQCFLGVKESSERSNWVSARAYCGAQAPGADLAQPNDIKALADYLEDNGYIGVGGLGEYWLGGSDLVTEGAWAWINGGCPITSAWAGGQPNSWRGEQDCLYMNPAHGANSLGDEHCTGTRGFICEKY